MLNISKYLGKFSKVVSDNKEQKNIISEIIKNFVGINIDTEKIEVKENKIKIQTSPAVKNIIFLNKKQILEELNKNVRQKITDIF
jgi:cell division protein FtsX